MVAPKARNKKKSISVKNRLKLLLHTLDVKSKIMLAALVLSVVGGSVAFGVLQNTKFKSNSRAEEPEQSVEQQVENNNQQINEAPLEGQDICKSTGPLNISGYDPINGQDYCSMGTACKDGYVLDQTTTCGEKTNCCRNKSWVQFAMTKKAPNAELCLNYSIKLKKDESWAASVNDAIAWSIYNSTGQTYWGEWETDYTKVTSFKCSK